MESYLKMGKDALKEEFSQSTARYKEWNAKHLNLDMSRGKPGADQLDLSEDYLKVVSNSSECFTEQGTDCRNYGGLDGIPEAKSLFAEIMEVQPAQVILGNNSSLTMMYDTLAREMLFGNVDSEKPWGQQGPIKFLCPVPGYDRHFLVTQTLGIEMINVKMNADGPDMDMVEALVAEDASIKGMWCVPKYSNPDGITYSDAVVKRLASMKTAAPDFRIMYDNAYVIHHLNETEDHLLNIMEECIKSGNPNRIYMYASTSKVVYAGSGVGAMASSKANIDYMKKYISVQTIGPDKLNQLRHVKYFKNVDGIKAHMKKHADIIRPKFQIVLDILEREFAGTEIAQWNKPNGGYFISLFTMKGCASAAVKLAKECGVTITPAGATYPYGQDPDDSNIRIAPTYPDISELEKAIEILCICIKIVTAKKLAEIE